MVIIRTYALTPPVGILLSRGSELSLAPVLKKVPSGVVRNWAGSFPFNYKALELN
jgi:hypothetical protein